MRARFADDDTRRLARAMPLIEHATAYYFADCAPIMRRYYAAAIFRCFSPRPLRMRRAVFTPIRCRAFCTVTFAAMPR